MDPDELGIFLTTVSLHDLEKTIPLVELFIAHLPDFTVHHKIDIGKIVHDFLLQTLTDDGRYVHEILDTLKTGLVGEDQAVVKDDCLHFSRGLLRFFAASRRRQLVDINLQSCLPRETALL